MPVRDRHGQLCATFERLSKKLRRMVRPLTLYERAALVRLANAADDRIRRD